MEEKQDNLKYIKESFKLKNQKLYKEAIESLYKVLEGETDDKTYIEVISQIGDLHILLKNYDHAIEQYEHVLEIDKTHEHSLSKLYEIYFELKEYNKALNIIKDICLTSKNPLDFVKYFSVLLKLSRADEILKIYETLSDDLKENPDILYLISLLKEDEKKEILTRVVKYSPGFIEAKFDLSMIYFNEENYLESEKLIDEILKLKKNPLAYYYKALHQKMRGEFFPAIDNLHLAIKASKGSIQEFYYELAKTYMDINWFDEAISTIKNSITLCIEKGEPKSIIDKRYLLLAWVFEKQKDYENALFNLKLIDPDSSVKNQADILSALVEYKKGEIIKAKTKLERIYKECTSLRNDFTLLDTLGLIYKDLKLYKSAIDFYEKHLAQFPDSIHSASEYIDLLIDIENYELAAEYIEKYSKKGIVTSLINSKARIYYRKKEYDKALGALDELIKYDRNCAEAYYFKGLIYNNLGEFKSAADNLQQALTLNPSPAKYYAQMAVANNGLGFNNEAILYIKEAIEIDPDDLNYKKLASDIYKSSGKDIEASFWDSIVKRTEAIIKDNKRF